MSRFSGQVCDRLAFGVLIVGVLLMAQPWVKAGFLWGFWMTLMGIVATTWTSRVTGDGR